MKILATSFKRSCSCTASVSQTLQQATANPRLCWRLLDTHRQVWVSLLWGHCSFFLGSDACKVLFVPSKSLFPQSCGSSVIKSHLPPKSNSLGLLSPFARSPGWVILEVTSRFKRLDLIDRVPEELWTEVHDIVQEAGTKTIPKKKRGKMVV